MSSKSNAERIGRPTCPVAALTIAIIVLGAFASLSHAQVKYVNILLFYERPESVRSFDAALDYIRVNEHFGFKVGYVEKVLSNGSDSSKLIKDLCQKVESLYKKPEGKKPDIILDFTRYGTPSEAVKMISRVMTLPTISGTFGQEGDIRGWRELTDKQKNYLIQIAPPADLAPQAIRSLVAYQDMTSGVVLFDDDYEMSHKYKALLQNLPTRHMITNLEKSTPALRRQLDRLVHLDVVNFFIASSPNEASAVLAEASDPYSRDGPYFSDEFAWYSLSMEPGMPHCSGCRDNVSVIHIEPKFPEDGANRRKFLQDKGYFKKEHLMDMFYFDLTFNAIAAVAALKKEGQWFTPGIHPCEEKETGPDDFELNLFDTLKNLELAKENCLGPFYFDPEKKTGESYGKFQMVMRRLEFKPFTAEPFTNVELGIWNTGYIERELIETSESVKPDWKAHAVLTVFRIITVVQPPFVYKIPGCDEKETKYSRCFTGYCIDLLDKIQEGLGFNFTIRNVSEYGYMADEEPHEWSGMIRELKDRKADVGLGAISVMAERESVVDFTVPFYDLVGVAILMKKPVIHTSLFKFLTVLENEVWAAILGTYFFTSFLMWAFDRWSPYSIQNNREKYKDCDEQRDFNFRECLWFCMTSLTPQGGGESPKMLSGRLVVATWWLFGFIIIASYTANLAAFLTVSRLDSTVDSLEDLGKQYKVQYAPMVGSPAWIYFNRMTNIEQRFNQMWKDMSMNDTIQDYWRSQIAVWEYPISHKYTRLLDAMKENDPPTSYQHALDRVRGKLPGQIDDFAFLDEATNIRYETTISCDVKFVGEEFSRKPYAIAVTQGSPLKDTFNHMILQLLNARTLETLKTHWWDENPHKIECPKEEVQSDGISIHNIGGVFIVIFIGIIMAVITMIFEYWWNRNKNTDDDDGEAGEKSPSEQYRITSTSLLARFSNRFGKQPSSANDLPSVEASMW